MATYRLLKEITISGLCLRVSIRIEVMPDIRDWDYRIKYRDKDLTMQVDKQTHKFLVEEIKVFLQSKGHDY